jgi:hypothetical protein
MSPIYGWITDSFAAPSFFFFFFPILLHLTINSRYIIIFLHVVTMACACFYCNMDIVELFMDFFLKQNKYIILIYLK